MKQKNIITRLRMPLPELSAYYRQKRNADLCAGKKLKHIIAREKFYPCFRLFLKLDRCFRKQTIKILGKQREFKGQYIFACTHIGQNDLENIYESLGRGCWWFVGDPDFMYKDISGLLVWLNGCIFLDLPFREDCHVAYQRAVELLKAGGSLMIYPEGARNGTENLPVMKLFPGTARMSKSTNTKIIPIAIEQYDKKFVINFGEELNPLDFEGESELTLKLRDTLASLKWEIWDGQGVFCRENIPDNYDIVFRKEFESRIYPYDTWESVESTRYRSKEDREYQLVRADIKKLKEK